MIDSGGKMSYRMKKINNYKIYLYVENVVFLDDVWGGEKHSFDSCPF